MKIPLSRFVGQFRDSATIQMAARARKMRQAGKAVIDLSLGEPDFNTPPHIKQAAVKAIEDNFSHYSPLAGYADLRTAIVKKLERDNALFYQPDNVIVSTGAKQSIANAIFSLINPGDEVLIPTPCWNSYVDIVRMAGGVVKLLPTRVGDQFHLSAEQLERSITPASKLFLFSSPSNPCGVTYNAEQLEQFGEVLGKHEHVAVLSDEIYEHLRYGAGAHASIGSVVHLQNRCAIVNGVSKGFAMTGWRIGYMVGPTEWVKACGKIQAQFTSGANSIAQKAAVAALIQPPHTCMKMRDTFQQRRDLLYDGLQAIAGLRVFKPEGAFYMFPDTSGVVGKKTPEGQVIESSMHIANDLLDNALVACVAAEVFEHTHALRLSFATSTANITEACRRIGQRLAQYV